MPQAYDYGTLEVKPKAKSKTYDYGALEQRPPATAATPPAPQRTPESYLDPADPHYQLKSTVLEGAQKAYSVARGAADIFRHPIDNLVVAPAKLAASTVYDIATTGRPKAATDAAETMLQPATVSARGAGALVAPRKVAPPSNEEFEQAARGAGANFGGILAGEVIAKAAPYVKAGVKAGAEAAIEAPKTASDFLRDRFKPAPEVAALRATASAKPEVRAAIPTVLDEVSQWSDETGQKVETTPQFRKAIDNRIKVHTEISDAIAKPHNDTVVEGSRAEMAQAKIDAIPDDIRSEKPGQYANLVKSIKAAADQPDYTIGELNDLRKSLNTKNKSFGKNRTASMAAEYSTNAIDQAAGDYARNKFYDALEKESGQGQAVRAIKKATGDLMTYDNALRSRENQSVVESGKSFAQKAVELTGKAMTPGTTLKHFGENATIDSDLASAVRQWKRRPASVLKAPVSPQQALPPGTGGFEIDPSAVQAYGRNPADMFRKPAEEGVGIQMRDVTPPKQKLLTGAPAKITTYIQRSSGKTFEMPAPVRALLDKYIQERKAIGPVKPKQLTAGDALRSRVFNMPGETSIADQMAHEWMNTFAELQEGGAGNLTGKLKATDPNANAGTQIMERFKGGFKNGTPWDKFPESPKQMRDAIRNGKGPLFERLKKAAMDTAQGIVDWEAQKTEDRFNRDTAGWDVEEN